MSKSRLFGYFVISFIVGVGARSLAKFDIFYGLVLAGLSLVMTIVWWNHKKWRVIVLGGVFLFLGIWRVQLAEPRIDQSHIGYYNGQKLEFIGQVIAEPDQRIDQTKLTLGNINNIELDENKCLHGRVLINVPNYPRYNYGDWVWVKCELSQPGMVQDFDYGKYLAVKGIYSVCYQVEALNHLNTGTLNHLNTGTLKHFRVNIRKGLINIKYRSKQIIDQSVAYPYSEVLGAIILGIRSNIPDDISESFSLAGISHIVAISGLHISIIGMLLMGVLMGMYIPRRRAFWMAMGVVLLFLLLIGFRASAVRAGIMGFMVMYAFKEGRLNKSINSLLLAAGILLLINPKLLLDDIGFQLSFLAVCGIIYLGEYIEKFLAKIKIPSWGEIRSILMMTFSAQALVLPLVVYYFGNLSVLAPVANLLVLPLLPFIMIGGFILIILGFVWLPLSYWFGYLVRLMVEWVVIVADRIILIPGASFNLGKIDWVWVFLVYLVILWLLWLMRDGARTRK